MNNKRNKINKKKEKKKKNPYEPLLVVKSLFFPKTILSFCVRIPQRNRTNKLYNARLDVSPLKFVLKVNPHCYGSNDSSSSFGKR
jgi:hypothetical protein